MQRYDALLTSINVCSQEPLNERAKYENELIRKSRNLEKIGTVLQSAHMYIRYTCCAISDHLVRDFCTGEL